MSIPNHEPFDPNHCIACKAAHFEQRAKRLEIERNEARSEARDGVRLLARIAELEQDRYHVWMRGFQAKALGAAPSSNPFPEPSIAVGVLPLPTVKP